MEAILKITNGLAVLLALFSIQVHSAVSRLQTPHSEKIDFALDIKAKTVSLLGKTYSTYVITGAKDQEAILYREGFPKLPALRFFVYADKAEDIEISFSKDAQDREVFKARNTLLPNVPSIPKIKGAKTFLTLDQRVYRQGIYPEMSFSIEPSGSIRGRKRQLVSIYPLQYNGATRELTFKSRITVNIKNNSIREASLLLKPTYLFVIGQKFEHHLSLKNFIAYKESQGFDVKKLIVTNSLKSPTLIREEMRKIYLNPSVNLRYALLIGDHEDIPGHEGQHIYGVTDHFYKCLDTEDYEDDLNAPDISLGRFSAALDTQLDRIISKQRRYESIRIEDNTWLQNASFIATDDQWELAEATHNHVLDGYMRDLGMSGNFPQVGLDGGDQLYAVTHKASRKDLQLYLNQGRGIINYSGHGQTTYWMEPEFTMDDVKKINHSEALPMVISNACVTGQFTVSESFAETWQRHQHGSIMFWGSMDNTYWEEDDILEKRLFAGIYDEGLREFGAMTDYALSEFWRIYGGSGKSKYYYETYILFADPETKLRTL